jgi:sulfur carrier protein
MIYITVNGESRCYVSPPGLGELLRDMSLADKRIAVEKNGEIVPRSRLGEEILRHGDRLEIVVAVGGG